MNWISVKKRMPEEGKIVFFFVTERANRVRKGIEIGYHRRCANYELWYGLNCERFASSEVIHWMPLPEPPREEV